MFYYRLFRRLEIKSKKIVNKTNICIDYNDNYIQYLYEFKGKYYDSCSNGNLIKIMPLKVVNVMKRNAKIAQKNHL